MHAHAQATITSPHQISQHIKNSPSRPCLKGYINRSYSTLPNSPQKGAKCLRCIVSTNNYNLHKTNMSPTGQNLMRPWYAGNNKETKLRPCSLRMLIICTKNAAAQHRTGARE